jgi:hypothetical protein
MSVDISEERTAFYFAVKVQVEAGGSSEITQTTSYNYAEDKNINIYFRKK